jgi:hypothetical protein
LTIELADPLPAMMPSQPWVSGILYRLDGRGAGEAEMIRASVLDRFGHPTSMHPMAWCERAGADGVCPADKPRLTFEPGPGVACRLFLTVGAAVPPPSH